MKIMSWLRQVIGGQADTATADRAIRLSDEVINSSRGLRQQLAPFAAEDDPFRAVATKTELAYSYEEGAEMSTPRAKP
jgi:hypothetical protein